MGKDRLDVLLEDFLAGLKSHPDEMWVSESAKVLYKEGVGLEGLLNLVRLEYGNDRCEAVSIILQKSTVEKIQPQAGVGGLLALLCFVLIVISPLRNVYEIYSGYVEVSPYFTVYPGLEKLSYFTLVLYVVVILLSVYSGIALLKCKPWAVRVAKIFLVVFLLVNLIQPALLFVFDLPDELVEASLEAPVSFYLPPVIFFIFWYGYLSTSTRVKLTYRS